MTLCLHYLCNYKLHWINGIFDGVQCMQFRWSQAILTVGKAARCKKKVKLKRWTHTNCPAHHRVYEEVQLHAHSMEYMAKEMLHLHLYNPKIKCWLHFVFIRLLRTAYPCTERSFPADCDFWFWYLRRKKADCVQRTSITSLMHSLFSLSF